MADTRVCAKRCIYQAMACSCGHLAGLLSELMCQLDPDSWTTQWSHIVTYVQPLRDNLVNFPLRTILDGTWSISAFHITYHLLPWASGGSATNSLSQHGHLTSLISCGCDDKRYLIDNQQSHWSQTSDWFDCVMQLFSISSTFKKVSS